MSLVIDALRLGVIEALRLDPVIAGLVGERVLDSRMSAYSDGEPVPVIAVYTEEDNGEAWSANNGGPPFNTTVDLVIEIMFQIRALADDGTPLIGIATTDRETEALLGILRTRCEDVIAVGDSAWSQLLRRHVILRVLSTNSKRFKTDDAATRAAMRLVTLKVEIKNADYQSDVATPPTGPFAALPRPVRDICEATDPNSSAHAACLVMASGMAPSLTPSVPFEAMGMVIRPGPLPRPDPTDGAEFEAEALPPQT